MPSTPPKLTTANMMLFDSLSSTMSLISPMWCPAASRTLVPATRVARMALVCPVAVVIEAALLVLVGPLLCGGWIRVLGPGPCSGAGTAPAGVAVTSYPAAGRRITATVAKCALATESRQLDRSPARRLRAIRRPLTGTPRPLALRRSHRHPPALPGMGRPARRTGAAAAAWLSGACALVGLRRAVARHALPR